MLADENKGNKVLALLANRAYHASVRRRTYKAEDVIEMLKRKQGKSGLRQFATELGISAPYLSDIYKGRRSPGPAVLEKLGLVRKDPPAPVYEVAV